MLCSRNFQKNFQITCIKFNPTGDLTGTCHFINFFLFIIKLFLKAIGFHNGQLQIIDSISLDDCLKSPFIYSKDSITHIEFSADSSFLATAVK